jgi:amidase
MFFRYKIADFQFLATLLLVCFFMLGCAQHESKEGIVEHPILWKPVSDSTLLNANANHPIPRMRFKRIQSVITDKNQIFSGLYAAANSIDVERYHRLLPLILDQPIPVIQQHISEGLFTYEELTLFFLYRIYRYELNPETTLHTILALNADAIEQARNCDKVMLTLPKEKRHPIFGMPVLLKDNIQARGMPTTAGAAALQQHRADDAFIVKRLREQGAIILGKVNLSEWAYYFCGGCPVGYSAIGGQTLNPYGRGVFETGGSSSGSGTAIAAGYALAAVGTETSGSILSPSGQNGIVGLKPTIGLLSRTGIVPISSTLDTPGPMTRNVIDAAILLDAMKGYDMEDQKAGKYYLEGTGFVPRTYSFKGKRFGAFRDLLQTDSLYASGIEILRQAGAEIVVVQPDEPDFTNFSTLLNADMKRDLAQYLKLQVADTTLVRIRSARDVVEFNTSDTSLYAPYGQARMEGVAADTTSEDQLKGIAEQLQAAGRNYFNEAWKEYRLDAFISVNNRHAGYAAVAEYPALLVPLGYRKSGVPVGLTIIGKPFQEELLLDMGRAFEVLHPVRKMPTTYLE